eukprot:XP_011447607.1 PREDICTED: extensin [Crassostrea gigas]
MIRFGFLALLFSVCLDCVSSQKPCDGVLGQQFRPDPADCRVYYLCGQGKDWRLQCGPNTVWSQEIGACVPVGSPEDTCTQSNKDPLPYTAPKGDPAARSPGSRHYSPFSESTWRPKCTPGSTKRFPHPSRCAQYYDCGGDPKEDWWGKHLRECPYPTVYDTTTGSCEYYTTVNCGQRKMPLDPCDYLAHSCRNAHCSPCHIRYATCSGLPDGINVWRGREKTPFYVVCQAQRVAFHGRCINPEPGKRQIYDGEYHTCGRPVDFEMGMVHHMHRGEIGKSQIVKQINHAKRVGKAEKRPKASMGKNNPAQQSGNQQKAQQASKPHINQPKANQASPQNTNNNNQPPQNKPNTPQPHVNQPNNNQQQQTPSSSSNNAANSQNSQHSPHVNQPKTAAPQSNTQTPPGPANQQTKAPVPSTPHANQPSAHANQPAAQANQPPVQANQPPAHVNQPPAHANQPPAHVNQPSAQANKPPAHANQPQSHAHAQQPPSQQNNYQPPQQQQYGPPAQGPPPNYGPPNNQPRAPQPHPNVAPQPHVNKPHTPVQHQRTPYAQPHSQPQAQKPNSLQSFIGEIQSKGRYQQPHPNRPVQYPNQPQSNTNAPLQVVRAKPGKRPPLPYMNSVPSVPRVPSVPSVPQSQPRNPIPRQHHIQQQPPPYSHPNQQRQPSYPHVPQPLPPVQQRPPAPVVAGPVHNGPSPAHHPNMPQTIQRPNTQPSYPQQPYAIPNRQHIAPQPAPQQRMYPQPVPRAPSHGPQPIQPRPVGPYPQPQLYNEPATIRQSISPKQNVNNISQKRYPVPTTQNKKRREPPRSLPLRRQTGK